jgi:hypothetical protein
VRDYFKVTMSGCFPPYYKVYEHTATQTMKFVHNYLASRHIKLLGSYIQSDDKLGGGPDLFLEVKDMLARMDDVAKDTQLVSFFNKYRSTSTSDQDSHPLIKDLQDQVGNHFSTFLEQSVIRFDQRFGRIIEDVMQ